MHPQPAASSLSRNAPLLGSFLDKIIHPLRDPDVQPSDEPADPSRPFTPPPPQPSQEEEEDDDNDGPSFPFNPALA